MCPWLKTLAALAMLAAPMLVSQDAPHPHLALWSGRATEAFVSPEFKVPAFDRAVLSWNCSGAADFELEVDGRRYLMGHWGEKPASAKTEAVDVDTLALKKPAAAFRFHVSPRDGASVTRVAVTYWLNAAIPAYSEKRSPAWGKTLAVPERSQGIEKKDPGAICSPTSLAMVLEFHGLSKSTREVCEGVFDHAEKIYGNWPLNTAYAHRVSGREAFVCRAGGLEDLEAEIAADRPVITSHRWKKGELDNAAVGESDGHLMVVAGFTAEGDVVVNDPAGKPGAVRRVYKRRQFFKSWMESGAGIMYIVR